MKADDLNCLFINITIGEKIRFKCFLRCCDNILANPDSLKDFEAEHFLLHNTSTDFDISISYGRKTSLGKTLN